jgi:hypothetical protein
MAVQFLYIDSLKKKEKSSFQLLNENFFPYHKQSLGFELFLVLLCIRNAFNVGSVKKCRGGVLLVYIKHVPESRKSANLFSNNEFVLFLFT